MSNPEAAGASALAAALTVVDKVTPARSALDWAAEMDAAFAAPRDQCGRVRPPQSHL